MTGAERAGSERASSQGADPVTSSTGTTGGAVRRCVGDAAAFVRDHWAKAPLLRRGAGPGGFDDLLSLADVDRFLSTSSPRTPAFRLVKDGQPLPPAAYTKPGRIGSQPLHDLADAGRVYDHFRAGATIVLQGLHRYWPPLTAFCRDLELFLTHPVQVNAYLTPPASRGLGVHHDTHDVFVLQVHGRKLWQVWDAAVPFPLPHQKKLPPGAAAPAEPPLVDAELAPGDCLYVPRGFRHAARTAETASLHLTVGMPTYNWNEVLRDVVEQATEEPWFREGLPVGFADDPAALRAGLAERVAELRRFLDKVDLDQVAERAARRFWAGRTPLLRGQLQQLLALDRLDDATVVRRRGGAVCRLRVTGERLTVLLGDRELTMPAQLAPAMRQVLAAGSFAVGELAPHLDGPSRLVLVRRLVREGLLESTAVA
jgi:bifunctional lysine-specific demethylase and histidyl-hydroxylase NO66